MRWRKTRGLFLDLLATLDQAYSPSQFTHLYVAVDNYKIHKAQAVERWLARHSRFKLLFLPTYCPKANSIERLLAMSMISVRAITSANG